MIKELVYNEHKIKVHVKDSTEKVQRSWGCGRFYDIDVLKLAEIECIRQRNMWAVDIGAGIGNHSLFFSTVMGKRVYAFEPDPVKYAQLSKNMILNPVENRIYNYALSDFAGKARVETQKGLVFFQKASEAFNVRVNVLNNFVWEPIGIMRIGVPEHMNLSILSGAKRCLKASKPGIFMHTSKPDEVIQALAAMKLNYTLKADLGKTKYFKPA